MKNYTIRNIRKFLKHDYMIYGIVKEIILNYEQRISSMYF